MNSFYKVSFEQYREASLSPTEVGLHDEWVDIKIPKRGTAFSAGYDFFAPFTFALDPGETILIPTGIRVELDPDKFLLCLPRSGQGFKYRLQLDNTAGVIDADYFFAENEGHIMAKITNDGREGKTLRVDKGQAFMQGIILQYFLTQHDAATATRTGGFGSTD